MFALSTVQNICIYMFSIVKAVFMSPFCSYFPCNSGGITIIILLEGNFSSVK